MRDGVAAKDYLELELLHKQLSQIEQSIQVADHEIDQANLTLEMLRELKDAKSNQEILIPLGSGAFCKVNAAAIKEVLMAVGAGVLVQRETTQAIKGIAQQQEELLAARTRSKRLHEEIIEKMIVAQEAIEKQMGK